jgi:effector-binding domain-containing protein
VVVVATVEPRLTAVVAETTTWPEYPAVWRRALDEVYGVVRDRPELSPGDGWHNVMLYKDDQPSVEVGVLVSAPFSPVGRVVASELPGGRVATATHHGDYAELGRAHDAVHGFAAEQELTLSGVRWEIYGHAHELTTEVYWLLAD